jgi:hypothetical protein
MIELLLIGIPVVVALAGTAAGVALGAYVNRMRRRR